MINGSGLIDDLLYGYYPPEEHWKYSTTEYHPHHKTEANLDDNLVKAAKEVVKKFDPSVKLDSYSIKSYNDIPGIIASSSRLRKKPGTEKEVIILSTERNPAANNWKERHATLLWRWPGERKFTLWNSTGALGQRFMEPELYNWINHVTTNQMYQHPDYYSCGTWTLAALIQKLKNERAANIEPVEKIPGFRLSQGQLETLLNNERAAIQYVSSNFHPSDALTSTMADEFANLDINKP